MAMTEWTKQKALKALDGMLEIERNEMLVRGEYISVEIDDELAERGAICGGHRACLVGSLWLGYGVKPEKGTFCWGEEFYKLPGTEDGRAAFLSRRPGLKVAYDALNDAAERCVSRALSNADYEDFHGEARRVYSGSLAETLFESGDTYDLKNDRAAMRRLIKSARRQIEAA